MSNSRWFAVISLLLGVVSCAAAIIVVPEVRCALGLDTNLTHGCTVRSAPRGGIVYPLTTPGSTSNPSASVEGTVRRIRARFEQVERDQALGRLDSLRKDIQGLGGDSAYASVYFNAGDIPKVRARVFEGDVRTSYQAYYDGGNLAFVYRTSSRLLPSGPVELEQQRFYFEAGRMVRWLDASHSEVSTGSGAYVDAEQRIRALGDRLLEGARAAGEVIVF